MMKRLRWKRYPRPPITAFMLLGMMVITLMSLGVSMWFITDKTYEVILFTRMMVWWTSVIFFFVAIEWLFKITVWITYRVRKLSRQMKGTYSRYNDED